MFQKFAMAVSLPLLLSATGDMARVDGPHPADRLNPAYLTLEPFALPIFDNGRIEGHVAAKLVIEGESRAAVSALTDQLPKIRSELLSTIIEYNRLYASGLAPIDAERLSRQLNDRRAVSEAGIRRVLIVELSAIPT